MPLSPIPPNLSTSQYEQLVLQALSEIAGPGAHLSSQPPILSTADYRHLVLYALQYIATHGGGGGGGGLTNPVSHILYDITATNTPQTGKTYWDAAFGTLNLGLNGATDSVQLKIGQAEYILARNAESTTINKGQVVYCDGATGDKMRVRLASNASAATSAKTVGIAAENIPAGELGYLIVRGQLDGLSLGSPFVAGDVLWLGSTAGSFTRTEPVYPAQKVCLGLVERAIPGNGLAYIQIKAFPRPVDLYAAGCIQFTHGLFTPSAGGATNYFAFPTDLTPNASPAARFFKFPFPVRIIGASVAANNAAAAVGQNANAVLNLWNVATSTASTLINNVQYSTSTNSEFVYNSAVPLSIDCNSSDEFSIQLLTPSFTTSPSLRHNIQLYFTLL